MCNKKLDMTSQNNYLTNADLLNSRQIWAGSSPWVEQLKSDVGTIS